LLASLQHQSSAPAHPSAALVQRRENALIRMPRSSAGRPEMVDVGPPPRDPQGPLADVYVNLIEFFDGTRPPGPRKGGLHALGRWSLSALAFVGTLGIWTGFRAVTYARRRRVVDPIFRNGGTTTGRLVDVSGYPAMDMTATLTFEYEVQGRLYRDSMPTSIHLRPHFLVGDPVTVIYDQADPGQSVVAYRWRP
jgi:hypothetical protein